MRTSHIVLAMSLVLLMLMGITSIATAAPAPDLVNMSFEDPQTTGTYKGAIPGWYVYDRYGIGMDTSVMYAPGLATDGVQVGYAREGWFAQHWVLSNGTWPATVAGNTYTFSADLGIDEASAAQGLRPRTISMCVYATPDMNTWEFLAKLDLNLIDLAPGTMQHFSTSFVCAPENNNVGWSLWLGFDQTEANSLTLIDNANLDITPVPEPASLASLGLGLMGLVGVISRKRN